MCKKLIGIGCVLGLALLCMAVLATPVSAADFNVEKVYKVQVEYWFFDTDHYYWSTYYETTDAVAASFMYALLRSARDSGNLQNVAPSAYWRYIPVDVRLITTYRLKPKITISAP